MNSENVLIKFLLSLGVLLAYDSFRRRDPATVTVTGPNGTVFVVERK